MAGDSPPPPKKNPYSQSDIENILIHTKTKTKYYMAD